MPDSQQVAVGGADMSKSSGYNRLEEGAASGWPARQQLTSLMEDEGEGAINALTSGGGVPKLVAMLGSSVTKGVPGTPSDLAQRREEFGSNVFESKQLKVRASLARRT